MKSKLILFLLLVSACSANQITPGSFGAEKSQVSAIKVVYEPKNSNDETAHVMSDLHIDQMLPDDVKANLIEPYQAYASSGKYTMVIAVKKMHIRHGAHKAFFGMFSRTDYIKALVSVYEGKKKVSTFYASAKGHSGAFSVTMEERVRSIVQELAHNIVHTFVASKPRK